MKLFGLNILTNNQLQKVIEDSRKELKETVKKLEGKGKLRNKIMAELLADNEALRIKLGSKH